MPDDRRRGAQVSEQSGDPGATRRRSAGATSGGRVSRVLRQKTKTKYWILIFKLFLQKSRMIFPASSYNGYSPREIVNGHTRRSFFPSRAAAAATLPRVTICPDIVTAYRDFPARLTLDASRLAWPPPTARRGEDERSAAAAGVDLGLPASLWGIVPRAFTMERRANASPLY